MTDTPRITIRRNQDGEFEVPTSSPLTPATSFEAGLYFTDDRNDALATAKAAWGGLATITFRSGTYQEA